MRWLHRSPRAPLVIEFERRSRAPASAWLFLALAIGFGADVAWSYVNVQQRTRAVMEELATLPAPRNNVAAARPYQPQDVAREAAFARGVTTRISLPWNTLFQALNATRIEEVQLVGIEPDAEARTLRISAEARDVPAMLTYVARLESHRYFRRVRLVEHEIKGEMGSAGVQPRAKGMPPITRVVASSGLANGVSFIVTASWNPT